MDPDKLQSYSYIEMTYHRITYFEFSETRVTLSSTEKLDTLRDKFVEKLDNSIKFHDTLYGFKEKTSAETR